MTGSDRVPDTVTEAVELLRSEGYTADFDVIEGVLRAEPGVACAVERAVVERLYRFEGPSDPGDEMIVFGLRDPATDTRGTLAVAFGLAADPEVTQHLADLRHRFG